MKCQCCRSHCRFLRKFHVLISFLELKKKTNPIIVDN